MGKGSFGIQFKHVRPVINIGLTSEDKDAILRYGQQKLDRFIGGRLTLILLGSL
jgi:hypothetical protein